MSTNQELPPDENETTSKDSSTIAQNTATNEPAETGSKPDSVSSVPQVENDTTSQNSAPNEGVNNPEEDDTGTLKKGSASHEIKPAEKETSKDSDNTTQAVETSKQEPDHTEDDNTSKISSPPDDDPPQTSSIDKQEAGGTKTSSQDSNPSVQEIPPTQDESASQNPLPPETAEIRNQKTEDTEASRRDSTTSADPNVQQIPTAQDESASQNPLPPEDNVSQTTGIRSQETEDNDATRQNSATLADSSVQEIPPAQDESASQNPLLPESNVSQTAEIRSQQTEDTEASRRDSTTLAYPSVQQIPPAQDESASQNPLPPEDDVSQTTEIRSQETQDNDAIRQDSATLADPQPVDTTPAENETISKESSPPKEDVTQSSQTRNQEIDAIEDHTREQDVKSSENEATASQSSSPNKIPAQSIETGTPEKVPNQHTATKDADFRREKISLWKRVCGFFKSKKVSSSKPTDESEPSSEVNRLPNLIKADLESVDKETSALTKYNKGLIGLLEDAKLEFGNDKCNHSELRKSMIKLKLLIPLQSNLDSDAFKDLQSRLKARESIPPDVLEKMPRLHENDIFYRSAETKDFEDLYKRLGPESKWLKICLLCFSIFPGNEIIRKRLMVRWWVAEGLSSEEEAEGHFRKLREEGFIVPVNNNRSPFVGRYRMHPLYQSMLKILTEKAKFFNFDAKGEPTQNFENSFQACLVGEGLLSYDDMKENKLTVDDLEKIHLVMNVNEPILDFKPNWFSMLRNVNVLYLGRWQASDAAHIEIEETGFLDELKNINSIKFLSLQGISNIIKLTESILSLKRLECLDVRACHNLEKIPSRIGLLTCLTHLDISECYLLDHMPKSLSELTNLKVFKGFVVKDKNPKNPTCTLADLKVLTKLTKLCIYTTWKQFPDENNVKCLEDLTKLLKLTIAWGGKALKEEKEGETSKPSEAGGDKSKGKEAPHKLPSQLTKLDLKCFPLKATPSWLDIAKLEKLRKLYIRGGRFSDLGQYQCTDSSDTLPHEKSVWKVKALRLKYLYDLEMEWRQLHELFPDLVYLEKINCPKLTLFNCGARGVWIDPTKLKDWEKHNFSDLGKTQFQ